MLDHIESDRLVNAPLVLFSNDEIRRNLSIVSH